jgi:hypothetical protein
MANDLDLPQIATAQSDNQHQTSNDADAAVANATTDIYSVDFSGGNVTLSAAQFRSAFIFVPSGLSANRDLTIPAVKRPFWVHNTDAADTISVKRGSTTIAVAPGQIGIFYADGTTDGLEGLVRDEGVSSALTDGDKGDITVASSGTAWTIDNDVVTYAKMQNVSATDKILGRSTAGAGDVEEIACTAAGRALIDDADAAAQRTTLGAAARAQTDFLSGIIASPANQDYRIALNLPYGLTIVNVTTRSASGTCTLTGKINTTALGGTANSVTSSESTQAHASSNAAVAGDDIVLTISSNSSCVDLSFLIEFTRTLA